MNLSKICSVSCTKLVNYRTENVILFINLCFSAQYENRRGRRRHRLHLCYPGSKFPDLLLTILVLETYTTSMVLIIGQNYMEYIYYRRPQSFYIF